MSEGAEVLRGPPPSVGTPGFFGNVPPGDPKVAWGIDYTEIMVPTELGPAPAWYVPGDSTTWVVAVHGQNGRRKAELKILPVVHRLGLPFLDITYRNDEGAPPSSDGLLHLGDAEWRDLEAALRQAQTMGARQFIPVRHLDGRGARNLHLPAFVAGLAGQVTEWRTGIDTDHPIQEAHDLVATGRRLGWEIQFEPFAQGEHTEAWNVDRARYDHLVNRFLSQNAS
ncbi:hypothetical protein ACWEPN_17820 [Nonomuraea wenchangensis]